jgi:tetratricopeptide (TPR) repeat protein
MCIPAHHKPPGVLVSGLLWALVVLAASASVRSHPGIDEQIADVTASIREHPEDASLYLRRGELHRIHRDWRLAEADFIKAGKLDEELAEVDLALGKLRLSAGEPEAALEPLDRYVAQRPEVAAGWLARGRARMAAGRYLDAAADLTRGIEHPQNPRPQPDDYIDRARALESAGPKHLDSALAGLDKGMADLGPAVTLQILAIELELKRGNPDGALARIDRIAAQSRRQETWLLRRGEILEQVGRVEEARRAYRATLESIETLPPGKRRVRAVQRLEAEARAGLDRLRPENEAGG